MGEVKAVASFSQEIEGKYGIKTYQETKNTYDWVMKSLDKGGFKNLKVEAKFHFQTSEISCSCENIEEFIEYAYGQDDYALISMAFSVKSGDISLCYISVNYSSNVYISTDTKNLLEKIVSLLKNTVLNETEENDPISVTYIGNQSNDVIINGDNNTVAANSSVAMDIKSPTNAEPKWKQNLRAIVQDLIANWIWYLLTAAVAVIITYFATK